MPSASKVLAYTLAGIPGVIGVAFVARYAYVTSDTAIDGASNAFLFGMVAAGAFAGPALAIIVAGRGRKRAAYTLGGLALLAILANWSHTLGAIANRGAGTEAERAKSAAAVADDHAALRRLVMQRAAMSFAPTTDEAVKAAQAAVVAAERIRAAECDKRGPNCRGRETEEQAKRDALAGVLASKTATDESVELDAKAAVIRARLASTKAVQGGNAIGEALGRFLPMSAASAATFQQGFVSAIVELLIAAALALPELLRSDKQAAARPVAESDRTSGGMDVVTPRIVRRRPTIAGVVLNDLPLLTARAGAESAGVFMLACLARAKGDETAAGAIYARYQRWCAEQTPALAALEPSTFAEQFASRCARAGIRTRRNGNRVYCLDVQLVA